jgi:hypothetical protein
MVKFNCYHLKSDLNDIDITNKEQPVNYNRIIYMVGFQIISMLDQLIEGNKIIPSIVGIERYNMSYNLGVEYGIGWYLLLIYLYQYI